jgi:hypothetical protein
MSTTAKRRALQGGPAKPFGDGQRRQIQDAVPVADYVAAVRDPSVLAGWLAAVKAYGFAVMTDCRLNPGALCKVVDLFGYVRETNYGRWFEVRAEVNQTIAYAILGSGAHGQSISRSGADAAGSGLSKHRRGRWIERGRRFCGGRALQAGSRRFRLLRFMSGPLRIYGNLRVCG